MASNLRSTADRSLSARRSRVPLQSAPRPEPWPPLPCTFPGFTVPETSKTLQEVRTSTLTAEFMSPPSGEPAKCFVDTKFLLRSVPEEIRGRTVGWKRAPACWDSTSPTEDYPLTSPPVAPPGVSGTAHDVPNDSGTKQKPRAGRTGSNRSKLEASDGRENDSVYVSLQRKGGIPRSVESYAGNNLQQGLVRNGERQYSDTAKGDSSTSGPIHSAAVDKAAAAGKAGGGISEASMKCAIDDRLLAHVDLEAILTGTARDTQSVVVGLDAFLSRNVSNFTLEPNAPHWVAGLTSAFRLIADNAVLLPKGQFLWELIYPQSESGWPLYNPQGLYYVKLFLHSQWRWVEIDDRIPCDASNKPLAPMSCRDPHIHELWPLLLTKAIWKAFQGEIAYGVPDTPIIEALSGRRQIMYPLTISTVRRFLTKGFWASIKIRATEIQGIGGSDSTEECAADSTAGGISFLLCDLGPDSTGRPQVCLRNTAFALKRFHPEEQGGRNGPVRSAADTQDAPPATAPEQSCAGGSSLSWVDADCEEEYGGVFSLVSADHPANRAEIMAEKAHAETQRRVNELRRGVNGSVVMCQPWGKLLNHFFGDVLPHPLPEVTLGDSSVFLGRTAFGLGSSATSSVKPTSGAAVAHDGHVPKLNKQLDAGGGWIPPKAKPPGSALTEIIQRHQMPWPPETMYELVEADGITYDGTEWVMWERLIKLCRSAHLYIYIPGTEFKTVSSSDFFDYEQGVLPAEFPLRAAVCCMNVQTGYTTRKKKGDRGHSEVESQTRQNGQSDPTCPEPQERPPMTRCIPRGQLSPIPVLLEFDAQPPITTAGTELMRVADQIPKHALSTHLPQNGRTADGRSRTAAQADTMRRYVGGVCIIQSVAFVRRHWKHTGSQRSVWERLGCLKGEEVMPLLGPELRNAVVQGIELWGAEQADLEGWQRGKGRSYRGKKRFLAHSSDGHLCCASFAARPTTAYALEICGGPRFLPLDASSRAQIQLNLSPGKHAFFFWLDSPAGSGALRVHWLSDKCAKDSIELEVPSLPSGGGASMKQGKKHAADVQPASKESHPTESTRGTSCEFMSIEDYLMMAHGIQMQEFFIAVPENALLGSWYNVWFKAELEVHPRFSLKGGSWQSSGAAGSASRSHEDTRDCSTSLFPTLFVTLNLPHGGLAPYLRLSIGQHRTELPANTERAPEGTSRLSENSFKFDAVVEAAYSAAARPELRGGGLQPDLRQLPICPLICIDLNELTKPRSHGQDPLAKRDEPTSTKTSGHPEAQPHRFLLILESALPPPSPALGFSVGIGSRDLEVEGSTRRSDRGQPEEQDGDGYPHQPPPSRIRLAVSSVSFRASWSDGTVTNGDNIVLRERMSPKGLQPVSASLSVTVQQLDRIVLHARILLIHRRPLSDSAPLEGSQKSPTPVAATSGLPLVTPRPPTQQPGGRSSNQAVSPGPASRESAATSSRELRNANATVPPAGAGRLAGYESNRNVAGMPSVALDFAHPRAPLEEILIESTGRQIVTFPHVQLDPGCDYVIEVTARKSVSTRGQVARHTVMQDHSIPPSGQADREDSACSFLATCDDTYDTTGEGATIEGSPESLPERWVRDIRATETASAERFRAAVPLDGGSWRLDVAATAEVEVAEDVCREDFERKLFALWSESDPTRAERAKKSRNAFLARNMKRVVPEEVDPPDALTSLAAFRQAVLWNLEMTELQLLRALVRSDVVVAEDTADAFSMGCSSSEAITIAAFSECKLLQDATEATRTELQEFFFSELDPAKTGSVNAAQFLMLLRSGAAPLRCSPKDAAEEMSAGGRQTRITKAANNDKRNKASGGDRDARRQGAAQKSPASKLSRWGGDDQRKDGQTGSLEGVKEQTPAHGCRALRRPLTSTPHRNTTISEFIQKLSARYTERTVTVPGVFLAGTPTGRDDGLKSAGFSPTSPPTPPEIRRAKNTATAERVAALRDSIERTSVRSGDVPRESDEKVRGMPLFYHDSLEQKRESLRTLQRSRRDVASRVSEMLQDDMQKEIQKEELQHLMDESEKTGMWLFDSCLTERLRNQYAAVKAMHRVQEILEKDAHGLKKDSDAIRKMARKKADKENQADNTVEKKDTSLTEADVDELAELLRTLERLYSLQGPTRPANCQRLYALLEIAKEICATKARQFPSRNSSPRHLDNPG
ncbi:hypothetical protein BESB_040630 [Besnoitia besnoiti]|uniref:Calpain catalytic domain-containing protein n=1 Tax=Besnoitia besnoiti TaxID=94643 RepID=A0A2A9MHZ7_BESBE|nr:hypothetical protein BESB_040630 [Besnoitia besnoiti]PFH37605.1 hypothetical protein BESB_040630 [Besnoitia besnoiti]